jgi:hypothetical protein
MNTDDLIDSLATRLAPVEPLPTPGRRSARWLLAAVAYVCVAAWLVATLSGAARLDAGMLWLPQVGAVLAGSCAALAAFTSVVPGYSRRTLLGAAAAIAIWIVTLLDASQPHDPAALTGEWPCLVVIALGGLPLLATLGLMLRRGAPLRRAWTGALAALAVGLLMNVGACLAQPHANGIDILVWHGGAIAALALLGAAAAPLVFGWRRAAATSRV